MEKILENMVDELNQILIMQGKRDNEFQKVQEQILREIKEIKTEVKGHEYRISKLELAQEKAS